MNFLSSDLEKITSKFSPLLSRDEVIIIDEHSFLQLFSAARPLSLDVQQGSVVMEHPVEDGTIISDHIVIKPTVVNVTFAFTGAYKATFDKFVSDFKNGNLLIIKTKVSIFANMAIEEIRHQETSDLFDIIIVDIRFKEVMFVRPEESAFNQDQVANLKDISSTKRGTLQTTEPNETDEQKAMDNYKNSTLMSSINVFRGQK